MAETLAEMSARLKREREASGGGGGRVIDQAAMAKAKKRRTYKGGPLKWSTYIKENPGATPGDFNKARLKREGEIRKARALQVAKSEAKPTPTPEKQ